MVARGGGEGNRELVFKGYRVSDWEEEKVLDLDGTLKKFWIWVV